MRRTLIWLLAAASAAGLLSGFITVILDSLDVTTITWILIGPTPFLAAGIYLMWKRPGHRTGEQLTALAGFSFALPLPLTQAVNTRYDLHGPEPWMWLAMALVSLSATAGIVVATRLVALLPDGRYHHRREHITLRALWLVLALVPLTTMANQQVYQQPMEFEGVSVVSPIYTEALDLVGPYLTAALDSVAVVFLVGIILVGLRYRELEEPSRRQVRWVLYGAGLTVVFGLGPFLLALLGFLPAVTHGPLSAVLFVPVLALPASVVVAVVEPSWLDRDWIARRSLIYSALSFLILIVYVTIASALGLAAEARLSVDIAIVVAVVAAIAFQPLRYRLQAVADRSVFGKRPTYIEALTGFRSDIEQAPEELLPRLAETLKSAIRLRWARVEVADQTAVAGTVEGEPIFSCLMQIAEDRIGVVECGPKLDSAALSDEDVLLVQTLTAQAALAIYNARLATRIVNAQEAERRRIERNIHDGAQQELVALVARLGMERARLKLEGIASPTLAELQDEAGRILADLRELAQGIHPSVLTDGGLLSAVEDRCGSLPIPVTLTSNQAVREERFSDEIEGAAYFFISEALANVLKHADAGSIRVSLQRRGTSLDLEVTDDGRGFAAADTTETGLAGLRDRIAALGGTVRVQSAPGAGTTATASLPVGGH